MDFSQYKKEDNPEKERKIYAWQTAIGLQKVDNLTPSKYLYHIAKENIEDKSFDNEILNCKIYFVYKENDIIIVFPDKKMKYPWDKDCSKLFANQI